MRSTRVTNAPLEKLIVGLVFPTAIQRGRYRFEHETSFVEPIGGNLRIYTIPDIYYTIPTIGLAEFAVRLEAIIIGRLFFDIHSRSLQCRQNALFGIFDGIISVTEHR